MTKYFEYNFVYFLVRLLFCIEYIGISPLRNLRRALQKYHYLSKGHGYYIRTYSLLHLFDRKSDKPTMAHFRNKRT